LKDTVGLTEENGCETTKERNGKDREREAKKEWEREKIRPQAQNLR